MSTSRQYGNIRNLHCPLARVRSDLSLESEAMLKHVLVVEGDPRVVHVLHFGIVTVAHAACKVETEK